jgi:predicted transcriptional regulator
LPLFFYLLALEVDVSHNEVIMPSAKERIAKILQDQPDDSSYDELLRELAFGRMIDRGLADSDAGKTISHEEMGRRIKTWQR